MPDNTQAKKRKTKTQDGSDLLEGEQPKEQAQQYDNSLKALFGDEAPSIVSQLLAGAVVTGEKNVEIDRSKLKADLVYQMTYDGVPAILNLELQTSAEQKIEQRLLQYHAGLHAKHDKPVLSVIIYPFKTTVPQPPYTVGTPNEVFLALHYKVICLWELDADPVVKNQVYCLYTLLPGMKGARPALLQQAIEEMTRHYTRQELGHRLIRFLLIMRRATVMSEEEKQEVEEVLRMQYAYDYFIDENPDVQERIAKKEAETAIKTKQDVILSMLNMRFPLLEVQAQSVIRNIQDLQQLDTLFKQVFQASDAQVVRTLLKLPTHDT